MLRDPTVRSFATNAVVHLTLQSETWLDGVLACREKMRLLDMHFSPNLLKTFKELRVRTLRELTAVKCSAEQVLPTFESFAGVIMKRFEARDISAVAEVTPRGEGANTVLLAGELPVGGA